MPYSEPDKPEQEEVVIPDVTGGSVSPIEKLGTFISLRIRNFRLLFTSTTLSCAGQWIQQVTLSWLVYDITGSGTILGSINMVRALASLGIIPIAGLLIDRLNRRKTLLIENSWLFIITLTLGLLLITGHSELWFLFIFAFLAGIAQTFDMTLRQVLVFDLVPRSHTPNAMALIQTGWGLTRSFGPALGGFLILWFGPGGNFLLQSTAYVLITITILKIHFPPRKPSAVRSSPMQNIKEGMQYVIKKPVTRTFTLMGLILPLLTIPVVTILPPVYAVEVFGDGSGRILGFLLASIGVGGMGGGFVTASLGHLERRGLLQIVSLFLLSLSLIAFALSTQLWLALIMLALTGFFEMIFLTTNQTLLQLSIPDSLRGRVTSVVNLNMALAPLGGLVAGVGSDFFGGPRTITIIFGSIAAALAIGFFLFAPIVRNYRLSQAINSEEATTPDVY